VEGCTSEVEVMFGPADLRIFEQMRRNGPDDAGPDFSLAQVSIVFSGHTEVRAQHVDALLALLGPIVG